jgi:secreted trypsin-like serine protease
MRRALTASIALTAILIAAQSPVRAITGNFVKDFEHPFVGLAALAAEPVFGDSGGPVFYGGSNSNTIVGITSFGLSAKTCAGTDFAFRTDQQSLIDWVLANAGREARDIAIVSLG